MLQDECKYQLKAGKCEVTGKHCSQYAKVCKIRLGREEVEKIEAMLAPYQDTINNFLEGSGYENKD